MCVQRFCGPSTLPSAHVQQGKSDRFVIVQRHIKPIVHFLIKAPKLVHT